MEQYPSELTSPPVPLVALIGKPELHPALGDFLRSQNVPRVHSIGIPDAHSAAGTFGRRKGTPSGTTTSGILKAGWLRKHRTSTPAVAALLVDRASVVGDPAAWAWLVSQLDAVKAAARGRGARVVILVAQKPGLPAAEVPEDRVAMICRQAGVERRCVLNFAPSEGLPALQVVGKVLHNQAVEFYMADAQRRLSAHPHRNVPSTDLNLRTAFKLGVLAEFRGDWAAALRMFREAYGYLSQVLSNCTGQPQRFAEVRAVAEYVHVKGVSLQLLALKQLPEAVAQFEAHLRMFRQLPFTPAPGLLASHHAWLSRQYTVMAELVMSSGVDRAALKREQQPGQLYLAAALAAIERRKVAAFISGMHGGKAPSLPGRVEPGLFVGQLLLLPADPAAAAVAAGGAAIAAALAGLPASALAAAAGAAKRLSEEQYELHLESEEGRVQHSKATVDLLHTAQDALRSSGRRTGKTLQRAMQLLGHELLESGNAAAAEPHLTQVAAFYQRERWEAPLASTLLLLRECRQQEHNLQAHTQLSLELAALSDSSLDAEQREAMATAALSVLAAGEEEEAGGSSGGLPASQPGGRLAEQEGDVAQQQALAGQRGQQGAHQQQGQGPSQTQCAYRVTSPQSGWLTVLPLCVGFFDPTHAVPPPSPGGPAAASSTTSGTVRFAAAVWNNAPVDLPLLSAELQLCDASGPFTVALAPHMAGSSSSGGDGSNGGDSSSGGQPAADGLVLQAGAWLRLSADIPVRCSGDLQATCLLLRLGVGGSGSSITFQLPKLFAAQERPAAAGAAVAAPPVAGWLRGGWTSSRLPFSSSAGFLAGRCSIEVPPQHAPPLLVLQASEVLLQGERAVVTLAVRAAAAHGILGSVLHCTAVHAESREQLVLTRGDTDAAQPADKVPDIAHPAEQEAGQEQSGAGHAQQAAGLQLQLGDLAAGEPRHLVLLLDARYRGAVHLSAELKYTAVTRSTAGTGHAHTATEAGHCTATLAVQVQLPWKLGLQLLGPPATHSLLSAAAERSAAEGSLGSPAILLLDQHQKRLQGLSVHDAPLPPSAASEAALGDGAKDLPALLLRSLPLQLVLPAGQRCTALVQLQSLAACQLDVLSMDMEPGDGVRLLPTAAVASDVGPAAVAACDTLCRSDVFAAAFAVASSAEAARELPSLGSLRVTWRRHQPRPVLLAAAACGASQLNAAAAAAAAETETAGAAGLGGSSSSVSSPAVCELLVPLPPVSFLRPLLTAAMHYPAAGTDGQPSELRLQLRNEGGSSQEVGVAVGDPHGSLLAGPKSTRVQVPPHSSASLSWQAVLYHTGPQTLPEITVAAAQHGQAVDVTRGCSMFVQRKSPRQEVQTAPEPSMEPGIV